MPCDKVRSFYKLTEGAFFFAPVKKDFSCFQRILWYNLNSYNSKKGKILWTKVLT